MSKTTKILIAVHELTGGTDPKKPVTIKAGEELTAARQKALGLDSDAAGDLIAKGAVREAEARVAEAAEKTAAQA